MAYIQNSPVLEVRNLSVSFQMNDGLYGQKMLQVISELNMKVHAGEILAIAGSSGSGKSVLASAVLGILPENAVVSGELRYNGQVLTHDLQKQLRGSEIALVPQSIEFLDPLMSVGVQADGHRKPYPARKRRELFKRLELPEDTGKRYPFQLSGGMVRRVLVSTAMIADARLVIADEPTPGMSVEQAVEALRYFGRWRRRERASC